MLLLLVILIYGNPDWAIPQMRSCIICLNLFFDIKYHKNLICHAWHLAKQCRQHFPTSNSITYACFELLHMDIWGPIVAHLLDGFQYFLTIVDDFTRYTWTFLMHNKSETRTHIHNFVAYFHTQFLMKIKTI